jgi:hypothetical protein
MIELMIVNSRDDDSSGEDISSSSSSSSRSRSSSSNSISCASTSYNNKAATFDNVILLSILEKTYSSHQHFL